MNGQALLIEERLATKADLERLELRLTLCPGAMVAASVTVVAALLRVL